eukprot:scaffold27_cov182-Ochromonas_danica.AAC.3
MREYEKSKSLLKIIHTIIMSIPAAVSRSSSSERKKRPCLLLTISSKKRKEEEEEEDDYNEQEEWEITMPPATTTTGGDDGGGGGGSVDLEDNDIDWCRLFDDEEEEEVEESHSPLPPATQHPMVLLLPKKKVVVGAVSDNRNHHDNNTTRNKNSTTEYWPTSSSTTSSSSYEEVDLTLPPKRRVRRLHNIPFPRIMKNDFRHNLSLIFTNVMNSANVEIVKRFYNEFCFSKCHYLDCATVRVKQMEEGSTTTSTTTSSGSGDSSGGSTTHALDIFDGVKPIDVQGIDKLIQRFNTFSQLIPDNSYELLHSYINRDMNQPGSRIVMKMKMTATVIKHGVVAVRSPCQRRYLVPSHTVEDLIKAKKIDRDSMKLEEHPEDAQNIALSILGETVLWLDNNHRIYRILTRGNLEVNYHN